MGLRGKIPSMIGQYKGKVFKKEKQTKICGHYLYYLFQLNVNQQFSENKMFNLKNERGMISRNSKVRISAMQWSSGPSTKSWLSWKEWLESTVLELWILIGHSPPPGQSSMKGENADLLWVNDKLEPTAISDSLAVGIAPPILEWQVVRPCLPKM